MHRFPELEKVKLWTLEDSWESMAYYQGDWRAAKFLA